MTELQRWPRVNKMLKKHLHTVICRAIPGYPPPLVREAQLKFAGQSTICVWLTECTVNLQNTDTNYTTGICPDGM